MDGFIMLRVYTLYILLQRAIALDYEYERELVNDEPEFSNYARLTKQQRYDQILSNLHSLFKKRSNDNNYEHSKSNDDYNDLNFNHNDRKHNDVSDVTSAIDNIKDNDELLTVESPMVQTNRYKRDISNKTVSNATSTEKNITQNNVTTTEKLETVILKKTVLRSNNDSDVPTNTRRMIQTEFISTHSRVKDKLLSYLEDTFKDVEKKIKPLTHIKIALSNDNHYKIGYIIATIDTLEVNLNKLKNDMDLYQHEWDEETILDLFDRIKATNTVATSLIESLKRYLHRN